MGERENKGRKRKRKKEKKKKRGTLGSKEYSIGPTSEGVNDVSVIAMSDGIDSPSYVSNGVPLTYIRKAQFLNKLIN